MKNLSPHEYSQSFAKQMVRVDRDSPPPFDFWEYFDRIPVADFEGHDCSDGVVTNCWAHPDGSMQHVLVNTEDHNTFMVLVLDVPSRTVLGHCLLDLNREYGLND
jgi:hypothetical protein